MGIVNEWISVDTIILLPPYNLDVLHLRITCVLILYTSLKHTQDNKVILVLSTYCTTLILS